MIWLNVFIKSICSYRG